MAHKPSLLARLVVPIVGLLACIGVAVAVFVNSARQTSPAPQAAQPATQQAGPQASTTSATPNAATPTTQTQSTQTQPAPTQTAPTPTTLTQPIPTQPAPAGPVLSAAPVSPNDLPPLKALVFQNDPLAADFAPLGSVDPASSFRGRVEFAEIGAGLRSLTLTRHFQHVDNKDRVVLQSEAALNNARLTPFAALGLEISRPGPASAADATLPVTAPGATPAATPAVTQAAPRPVFVSLARGVPGGPVWRQVAADTPGHFEAFIVDDAGAKILRAERIYSLAPDAYGFTLTQRITNLSAEPYAVRWYQLGPVDLPQEGAYGGDKRRLRFGHLVSVAADPARQAVVSNDYLITHSSALGSRDKATGVFRDTAVQWPMSPEARRTFQPPLWPNAKADESGYELVWAGMISRYFGVAVHPIVNNADPRADLRLRAFENVGRVVLDKGPKNEVLAMRLVSPAATVAPGAVLDLSVGVYAGPLAKREINASPVAKRLGLDQLIVYNFGGPCGPCTFEVFTHTLLALLRVLHDYVFFDWSLAIIALVLIVRGVLHPVTRWSQIRMQRFGKQMQAMAPKQQKLQEKFGNDRQKMQQEMAKLWKEEGVSPMGMLGCLPMFLVMPVWIALYATLYFAQELRQVPAFYGVVQAITGGNWHFLADLAEPDHFIEFGQSFHIPLLSTMMGPITGFNILPLILGVVFFVHQKYLTPPTTMQMTPEQEFQQKMVKWMSVILFPLFMYNAPSGLALYFTANSAFAIFENKWIRAHIDKHDLLNPEKFKKKPKPGAPAGGGFMDRLRQEAERRMKDAEAKKKQQKR